ncbi:hypothetical protein BDA99DRAFT_575529, partial [Phascolomyces articulosus]
MTDGHNNNTTATTANISSLTLWNNMDDDIQALINSYYYCDAFHVEHETLWSSLSVDRVDQFLADTVSSLPEEYDDYLFPSTTITTMLNFSSSSSSSSQQQLTRSLSINNNNNNNNNIKDYFMNNNNHVHYQSYHLSPTTRSETPSEDPPSLSSSSLSLD